MSDETPVPDEKSPQSAPPLRSDEGPVEPEQERIAIPSAHPVVVYTLLRLGILLVVGGVLYLGGLRGVWLILFAFLVSGVVSAFALSRRREGAAYGLITSVRNVNARIDASARAEDVDDATDFDTTDVDTTTVDTTTVDTTDVAAPAATDERPGGQSGG